LLTLVVPGVRSPRWIAFAQEPAFAAASVKPGSATSESGSNGRVNATAGRFRGLNAPARLLIRWAYDVKDYQIVGGPKWMAEDRFDVEGKTEEATPQPQVRAMLRTLLAERFQLTVHRESKTMSVYNLMVGKNGAKFKELKAGERAVPGPSKPGATGRMFASSVGGFADMLSTFPSIGKPVLDKTGLTGNYFIDIQSGPEDDVFTIVQDQGLRLESVNAPIEMLVVDRLEKPSSN